MNICRICKGVETPENICDSCLREDFYAPETEHTPTPSTYVLAVRRYYDRVNGNSYFSMRIIGNGVDIICPMEYGHGDLTYKMRACKELGIDWAVLDWEERRPLFTVEETVVTRQKDLHKKGNN